LEQSRANSFEFWRSTAVRTAELIGLRPVARPTQPVPSEVHREAG
jgi:glucan 1,3-beta-glucosidase